MKLKLGISFESPLVILHQSGPVVQPKLRCVLTMKLPNNITISGENMAQTFQVGHYVTVTAQWKNELGQPAEVENCQFQSSDETVFTATPSTGNPLICNLFMVAPGSAQLTVTGDADLGEGVDTISDVDDISVVPGKAVGADLAYTDMGIGPPSGAAAAAPAKK